jgi:hypothetical protein
VQEQVLDCFTVASPVPAGKLTITQSEQQEKKWVKLLPAVYFVSDLTPTIAC